MQSGKPPKAVKFKDVADLSRDNYDLRSEVQV